jgi:ribosomal protein S18 acetylase RimI-like enzyme
MSDDSITVRPARQADVALMARWAEAMAFETEHKQLPPAVVLRGIQRAFDDPAKGRYFIAEIDGRPAGTLMYTLEWSDWRDGWWWWIQSVYVDVDFRRRGVYRALYAHLLDLAQADADVTGLRLYVERENTSAKRTYELLGMRDAGYDIYEASISRG